MVWRFENLKEARRQRFCKLTTTIWKEIFRGWFSYAKRRLLKNSGSNNGCQIKEKKKQRKRDNGKPRNTKTSSA